MTQPQAELWFRDYAKAFDAFDAEAIADRLYVPCTIVGQGYVVVLSTRQEAVDNFRAVCENHRNLGYHHAELEECAIASAQDRGVVEARTTWAFRKADGALIDRFKMVYFLTVHDGAWKIAVAVNV